MYFLNSFHRRPGQKEDNLAPNCQASSLSLQCLLPTQRTLRPHRTGGLKPCFFVTTLGVAETDFPPQFLAHLDWFGSSFFQVVVSAWESEHFHHSLPSCSHFFVQLLCDGPTKLAEITQHSSCQHHFVATSGSPGDWLLGEVNARFDDLELTNFSEHWPPLQFG